MENKYLFSNLEDGPAVKGLNGYDLWYLNDKYYTEEEWVNKIAKDRKERFIYKMNGIDAFLEEMNF